MPFSDLINNQDVLFRASFNSNKTADYSNVFTETTVGGNTLDAAHPFGGGLNSLKVSETASTGAFDTYAIPNRSNTNKLLTGNHTILECWVKYTLGASNAVAQWAICNLNEYNATYGESTTLDVQITGGTWTGTGTVGTLQVIGRNSGGVNTIYSTDFVVPNQWNLIQIDKFTDNRLDIYINGKYSNSTSGSGRTADNLVQFQIGQMKGIQGVAGDSQLNIAEFTCYNRLLTHEEKYLRYKYKQSAPAFLSTQLTDGALVQMRFDNPNKSTAMVLYGSESSTWGNTFASVGAGNNGIVAAQTGKKDLAWSVQPQAGVQTSISAPNAWRQGLSNVMQSGGSYSIEWVNYVPTSSTTTQRYFEFGGNDATGLTGGYLQCQFSASTAASSQGQPSVSVGYRSTTTGALQFGTLSSIPNVTTRATNRNFLKMNNGLFNHYVLTVNRTGTNLIVILYINGVPMRSRDYGNGTYPSNYTNASILNPAYFAPNSITADSAYLYDNFAVYNKMLTQSEIDNHYFALISSDPITRTVKYYDGTTWQTSSAQKVWNGTAWVDWTAKRYDGSTWVSV